MLRWLVLSLLFSSNALAQPIPARIPSGLAPLAIECRGGQLRACYDLGVRYQTGDGVRRDYRVTRALFEHACDGGDTYGCNGLGRLYEHGHGVRRDPARALAFYERACIGDDWPVCYYIGWLYANGHLVRTSIDDARRYYRQACDHGFADACVALELPPLVDPVVLRAALARWLLDAGAAALAAARGQAHDRRFDGDARRDLRATSRALVSGSISAVVWLFEYSEFVSDTRYTAIQVMAFAFPDGRLRWAVRAEERSGRPDRAMVEATDITRGPAFLSWPLHDVLNRLLRGEAPPDLVTPAEVAALPAPIQQDVQTGISGLAASRRLAPRVADAEWITSSRFVSAIVGNTQVATNVRVRESGVSLDAATVQAFP